MLKFKSCLKGYKQNEEKGFFSKRKDVLDR